MYSRTKQRERKQKYTTYLLRTKCLLFVCSWSSIWLFFRQSQVLNPSSALLNLIFFILLILTSFCSNLLICLLYTFWHFTPLFHQFGFVNSLKVYLKSHLFCLNLRCFAGIRAVGPARHLKVHNVVACTSFFLDSFFVYVPRLYFHSGNRQPLTKAFCSLRFRWPPLLLSLGSSWSVCVLNSSTLLWSGMLTANTSGLAEM